MKMDQPVPTNNVIPNQTIATKVVTTPRIMLGPQVIGARPGQPGVFEYTSEFSEFLKKSTNATRESATAAPVELSPRAASSPSTADDAKNDDVAHCQDTILSSPPVPSSPLSISSSTVLIKSISNQSESATTDSTGNLASPLPTSPGILISTLSPPDSTARSRAGSGSELSPKGCQDEENQGLSFSSASPRPSTEIEDSHGDIIIFPKMTANISPPHPPTPPEPDSSGECTLQESLDSGGTGESLEQKDENKKDESCDRSPQLQPCESSTLLVPIEEELLQNQNPSPDLGLISHTPVPEPEVIFVKERNTSRTFSSGAYRESAEEKESERASHRYSSLTQQFSPKPCLAELFETREKSVTPVISYSQVPQISPVRRSSRGSELCPQEQPSHIQIQILPYPNPKGPTLSSYHNSQEMQGRVRDHSNNFNSKTDTSSINTYGAYSANTFSPSDFNYNHLLSLSPQPQPEPQHHQHQQFFTNDPGLHSQFLEYTETHPIGESAKGRKISLPVPPSPEAVNKSPSFSHSPVMPSPTSGPYFQRRDSIPNHFPPHHNEYAGTRIPEAHPSLHSPRYNSSYVGPAALTPSFQPGFSDATKVHRLQQQTQPHQIPTLYQNPHHQQTRNLSIPHQQPVARSQFDQNNYRNTHNLRPHEVQPAHAQLSPKLKPPTSPQLPRVAAAPPWIPPHHHTARPSGQVPYRPIQASILPSSNTGTPNRVTTDYYSHSTTTQPPVQMRHAHTNSYHQGSSSNNLGKPLPYAPPPLQFDPFDKVQSPRYPPTSSQYIYPAPGIPSHSTVVGQIPPILGSSSGQGIRTSHSSQHSSHIAHQSSSSYAQQPTSHYPSEHHPIPHYNNNLRGSSISPSSGYYVGNQHRYSAGQEPQSGQGHPGTYSGGVGGYPVVCRVTPIRSRLEPPGGQERGYLHPDPSFPKNSFNFESSRMLSPISDQRLPLQGSVNHRQEYDSYNSYSCQYNDAMRRLSTMTPDTAKQKCKNFLSFLLELSMKQNQTVARNVRGLIQGLVDGKVNAEDFSDRLQKEVNSQPQPCLVGFLKKSLPPLRQSLANKELTIEGIRPPPITSLTTIVPPTQPIITPQIRPHVPVAPPVRIIAPINTSTNVFPSASPVIPSTTPIPRSTVAAVQQRFAALPKSSPKSKAAKADKDKGEGSPLASKSGSKGKEKADKKSFGSGGTFGGDDDINDVAAMGGVNLAEESQRILGSTELIGTQIRSCQDEPFIKGSSLQGKIKHLAANHGFEEPSPEVAVMISHAVEEHIKTMIEKLALIAEHRLDVIKLDERYEVTQDVKGQLRFLEELEKLERKRHDEQEREMLIKAAKSRSKSEDPEQAKLKAKAKEMQRVQQEELRQREANLTALQAIGPRKKPKLDTPTGSQSTTAQNPVVGLGALSNTSRPHIPLRPRLKRVSMRDVLFLLESEGEMRRSEYLYKQFLK